MKTVILFPGLDALFMASKLKRWLENPGILNTLKEASGYLQEATGQDEDLAAFIANNARLHLADFDRTLVALTALQVGIARQLESRLKWDLVLGCSHGDIGRSVICEIFSFRDAVRLLWIFAELRKTCPKGSTANVRNKDGSPLKAEDIAWFKSMQTPVSLWSDTNATIGGDDETLGKIVAQAEARGLKVKPVLPYPVHSPSMQPSVDYLRSISGQFPLQRPKWPVFSSVWVRHISEPQEIAEEALASSINEVRWVETLAHVHEVEGCNHFINVGPSNTLTGWLFNSPRFAGIKLTDAWDVLMGAPK